jgi:two-component system sensor histidine kinase AlgZ
MAGADLAAVPWLPDFCRLPRIAAVIAAAETVVVILALASIGMGGWGLSEFLAASLFASWIALCSAVAWCHLRRALLRLPVVLGLALALAVPMLVGGLGAYFVQSIDFGLGFGYTVRPDRLLPFVAGVALLCGLMGAGVLRYVFVREQWQAQVQAQAKASVDALQARIRPHFLFNSMNSIAALVRHDPASAERAIEDLAELFRAALGAGQGAAALDEEIALARSYLAIEQLRLGERLRQRWQLPDPLPELSLPRLVLQPLLENAVLHGVSRLPEGGEISVAIERVGGDLRIRVENPAPPGRERDAGNRHAQDSIAQRLAYHFGSTARLEAGYADGIYRCELWLPLPE